MVTWFFFRERKDTPDETSYSDSDTQVTLDALVFAESVEEVCQVLEAWEATLCTEHTLIILCLTLFQTFVNGDQQDFEAVAILLNLVEYARAHGVSQTCNILLTIQDDMEREDMLAIPLSRKIALLAQALDALEQTDHPLIAAKLCCELGDNYAQAFDDESEATLIEQAITSYTAALTILEGEDVPFLLGYAYMRRGIVSMHRQQGDRRENLDQALADFDAALYTLTYIDTPVEWATTCMQRGLLYLDDPGDEREDNLLKAIADFTDALSVFTAVDAPQEWAFIHMQRGLASVALPQSARTEHLERAITDLETALETFTREHDAQAWAYIYKHLAMAYAVRVTDRHSKNIQQAIEAYIKALTVFTREHSPYENRDIYFNLAQLYIETGQQQEVQSAFAALRETTLYLEKLAQSEVQVEQQHATAMSSDDAPISGTVEAFLAIPDMGQMYAFLIEHQAILLSDAALAYLRREYSNIQESDQDGRAEYLEVYIHLLEHAQKQSLEVAWQHYLSVQLPVVEAATLLSTAQTFDEAGRRVAEQKDIFSSPAMIAMLYRIALLTDSANNTMVAQQIQQTIRILKQARAGHISLVPSEPTQPITHDATESSFSLTNQPVPSENSAFFTLKPSHVANFDWDELYLQYLLRELQQLSPEEMVDVLPFFAQMGTNMPTMDIASIGKASQKLLAKVDGGKLPYLSAGLHASAAAACFFVEQDNPQMALDHCAAALSTLTHENAPSMWSSLLLIRSCTQVHRCIHHNARDSDSVERVEHFRQAITDLNTVEAHFTHANKLYESAMVRVTRGMARVELARLNEQADYSEDDVLADLDAALPIISEKGNAAQCIFLHYYRAMTLFRYQGGDRRANLEQAITDCDKAIVLCQSPVSHEMLEMRADVLVIRGLAYLERVEGGVRENVEQAIKDFDMALADYMRTDNQRDKAITLVNRGNAYTAHVEGDRSRNLEQALQDYTDALAFLRREQDANSFEIAQALISRSSCYLIRIVENKAQNQTRALDDINEAIALFARVNRPIERAIALANRASLYILRLADERRQNFQQALKDCNEALEYFSPEKTSQWWAKTLTNRGSIHRSLALSIGFTQRGVGMRNLLSRIVSGHAEAMGTVVDESTQHFDHALADYSAALTVLTRENAPRDWASVMRERALTYALQVKGYFTGEREQNIRKGILDYDAALTVFSRYETPQEWAVTICNRGILYGELVSPQHQQEAELALADMQEAMSVFTRQIAPANFRRIQYIRANIFEKLERWVEAHAALLVAREAQRDLVATTMQAQDQADIIAEFALADIYVQDAWAMLHLSSPDYGAIVAALEEGRAQCLRAALNLDVINLERFHSPATRERMQQFIAARNQWRKAQHQAIQRVSDPQMQKSVHKAYLAFDEARKNIRLLDNPDFMTPVPTLNDVASALQTTDEALVYLVADPATAMEISCGMAFIVRRNTSNMPQVRYILLPQLREMSLFDLIDVEHGQTPTIRVTEAIATLGEMGLGRVAETLLQEGIRKVRLIPYGWLGIFPLASVLVSSANGTQRHLSDMFEEITIVPSARALEIAHKRSRSGGQTRRNILVAGNPRPLPSGVQDLPFAEAEADTIRRIAKRYGYPSGQVKYLLPTETTRERVIDALQLAKYAHLALHGEYCIDEPRRSRLLLAGNEHLPEQERNLALGEALDGDIDLQGLTLLVLSACETSIIDMQRIPNEMVGLAAGFLQAGAVGVIASLWAVHDEATYLLMSRFAQLYLDSQGIWSPARALAEAQRWLREEATNRVLAELNPLPSTTSTTLRSLRHTHTSVKAHIRFQATAPGADSEALPYADPFYWAGFVLMGI